MVKGYGLGLRARVTGFSVCTIFAILTSPHFGCSSFSFVIDIILSKLFQKVSGFVSFDTGFFRWMVPMEKPTSGIVGIVILWRQCGGRFTSNQIRRVCGENRTRLWEDGVIGHLWGIGHVCGTGHVCESYIYICCEVFLMNIIVL